MCTKQNSLSVCCSSAACWASHWPITLHEASRMFQRALKKNTSHKKSNNVGESLNQSSSQVLKILETLWSRICFQWPGPETIISTALSKCLWSKTIEGTPYIEVNNKNQANDSPPIAAEMLAIIPDANAIQQRKSTWRSVSVGWLLRGKSSRPEVRVCKEKKRTVGTC